MRFTIKVKPAIYKEDSYFGIMSKVSRGHYKTFSSKFGFCLVSLSSFGKSGGKVRIYNLHKVRGKSKQVKYKSGEKKGQTKSSTIVRNSGWIAYVYDFDISMLNILGVRVRQNTRNFVIEKK